ncbi:MOSC domain-containing protein [Umezawaea sp.]|uniref:MOSC domain-containing protein n=1 Tax=Umezawaea sp. TaxID=1955258 RepID=UPI002ED5CA25
MSFPTPAGRVDLLLVAPSRTEFSTFPVTAAEFDLEANKIVGSVRNAGRVVAADVRCRAYRRGTTVLNRQSVSLISDTDLDHIAAGLGLDERACLDGLRALGAAHVDTDGVDVAAHAALLDGLADGEAGRLFLAQCLGVNVVVGGFAGEGAIPDFGALPAGVDFGPYDRVRRRFTDAAVVVTRVNEPCARPAALVEKYYPRPIGRLGKRFVRVAAGRRGYVGMVARGGSMAVGQSLGFVPFGAR